MKPRAFLLVDDEEWPRAKHPALIEARWKAMFGEEVKVHACADILQDDLPPEHSIALKNVGAYDAVLLDVWWGRPPDSGRPHGIDIADMVRREFPELPIIVFSENAQLEDFERLLPLGIAAYLSKSVDNAAGWCATINDVLEQAGRQWAGYPLYRCLRDLLGQRPDAWCGSIVGSIASEIWRIENPYVKWEQFWEQWTSYLGPKRLNIPCDDMATFFAKDEQLTLAVDQMMRAHLEHVMFVYFTGYVLSHVVEGFRDHVLRAVRNLLRRDYQESRQDDYWDAFQLGWLLVATLHDTAYPLEVLPDLLREGQDIARTFPFAQNEPAIPSLAAKGFRWKTKDGATAKAAFENVLLRIHEEKKGDVITKNVVYEKGGTVRFNHGVASGARFMSWAASWATTPGAPPEAFLQWAATAMALHGLKHVAKQWGFCLELEKDPLAFLLALCDELQVWNRGRPDDTPATSHFRRIELAALHVADGKLAARVEYDLFSRTDDERRREAAKGLARRLNEDQLLLQDFLKPAPLSVEIQNRLRDWDDELPSILLE